MRRLAVNGLLKHKTATDEAALVFDAATGEVLAEHPGGRPLCIRSGNPNVVVAIGTPAEIAAERARLEG